MMEWLRGDRPRVVMFEYLGRTDLRETMALFGDARYTILVLTPRGAAIATAEVPPSQDLFACPDELLPEFVADHTTNS